MQNNFKRMATFLVTSGDAGLPAGATTLNNNATGAVNLADGQVGIFDASGNNTNAINTALTAGNTAVDSSIIKIYQGNANSADPASAHVNATYPLAARPYEASQKISAYNVVSVTKQDAELPSTSAWIVGQPAGSTGEITAVGTTLFEMEVAYNGNIIDNMYDYRGTTKSRFEYTTPDYTALATAEPRDHLIQNIAAVANRNSRLISATSGRRRGNDYIVALALDSTGANGTDASTLTAGTVLPVINGTNGLRNITLTADQATSIQTALAGAGFAANTGILTIDTTTAGTTTGGVADALLLLALDRNLSYIDYKSQVKIKLSVGLPKGFYDGTYHQEQSFPYEGEGQGRALSLEYSATHGQRKYAGRHEEFPVINYPNPVDETLTYTRYIIEHVDRHQSNIGSNIVSPMRETILVPTGDTTTTAAIEAVLTPWLASVDKAIKTY